MKKIIVGAVLLGISGLNVYLPSVGNLFDVWRIAGSIVLFGFGMFMLTEGITDSV